ncbi:MAG: rubredoxin [Deltaproteobacteria bacterium]|nr:rubredoxin [Deltaproteobacteria bacterium]MBN2845091.1 rubredoxin [Deltaproteobacteria bacterium]
MDKQALRDISYGLYLVTSVSGEKVNGQIANTVFQVCSETPKIAISINKDNLTHEYIKKSGVVAISVLEQDTPMTFIGNFGFKSGKDIDKFSQVKYEKGETGAPIVSENTLSYIEGKVVDSADVGTHTLFVVDVVDAKVLKEGVPMTYDYYHAVKKGKSPKNAPTYINEKEAEKAPEKPVKEEMKMERYVCTVCGYVYDPAEGDSEGGIPAGTAFENLPDDWTCPVCGAAKDEFEPE